MSEASESGVTTARVYTGVCRCSAMWSESRIVISLLSELPYMQHMLAGPNAIGHVRPAAMRVGSPSI
jgi:hypothetical protein